MIQKFGHLFQIHKVEEKLWQHLKTPIFVPLKSKTMTRNRKKKRLEFSQCLAMPHPMDELCTLPNHCLSNFYCQTCQLDLSHPIFQRDDSSNNKFVQSENRRRKPGEHLGFGHGGHPLLSPDPWQVELVQRFLQHRNIDHGDRSYRRYILVHGDTVLK